MKAPRHSEIWLRPYVADRLQRLFASGSPAVRRVWLLIADHYEPFWNRADFSTARRRVDAWRSRWPEIAASATADSTNSPPRYTFFYPEEQYHPEILESLAEMTRSGIADVEVHIHHDGEGRKDFIDRIGTFCQRLSERHGLLRDVDGHLRFGFIHGNWALDNSLPGGRWCGLNDEITILRDLGCYADFTMPSGGSPSQARIINSIYWCTDDPQAPKSYDQGTVVRPREGTTGDLLMVPGPFGLRWNGRILPRLETGELAANDLPSPYRVRRWFDLAPRIGEDLFIKLYTHGAPERNLTALLGAGLRDTFTLVKEEAERLGASLYFVSAWQMYRAIVAIGRGKDPTRALVEATSPTAVKEYTQRC
jgi:hypothetical protein